MADKDDMEVERRRGYDQAILEGIRTRLIEIQADQKEIKQGLDQLRSSASGSVIAIQALQVAGQDRENRLRRLEDSDRRWAAAAVLVSSVISALLTVLGHVVWR